MLQNQEEKTKKEKKAVAEKPEKAAKKKARERKPSALRKDHLKVIAALARDLPKRTAFSMSDIAKAKFKEGPHITADRVARNSVRKPRQLGLVEICERGEYRLTPAGAVFHKNIDSYEAAPDMQREAKAPKKGTAKKAAKAEKVAKPAKAAKAEKSPKKTTKPEKVAKAAKSAKKAEKAEKPAKKAKKVRTSDPDFPDDPEEQVSSKDDADSVPPQEDPQEEEVTEA